MLNLMTCNTALAGFRMTQTTSKVWKEKYIKPQTKTFIQSVIFIVVVFGVVVVADDVVIVVIY
jgi:hypothetical protein